MIEFRKIDDSELEVAYRLHCRVVEQMLAKGIRQWLRPIDKYKLEERQKKGENFGLFIDGRLLVFLSLVHRTEYFEWESRMQGNESIWLNTVSVEPNSSNKGLGKSAILKAIEYLESKDVKELYLDCVINDGFLVNYYQTIGFTLLSEATVTYRTGTFRLALMKKIII